MQASGKDRIVKNTVLGIVTLLSVGLGLELGKAWDSPHRIICGTNAGNEIYCTSWEGMEHGRWERLPGELKQIVVRDGQVWGVNIHGVIFYAADFRHPQWQSLPGPRAKEISEGHGVLCYVNDGDQIWCADKNITTSPEWHKAPDGASLKFITVN